jgi:peroxiredoxin Q/BCP
MTLKNHPHSSEIAHDSTEPWLGKTLPPFALQGTSQQSLSDSDLRARGRWTVLYFYPKDNTPGCTLESQQFRDLQPQFDALGADIFGVSKDSLSSHEKFKSQECMPFELLSDPEAQLCQALGIFQEKSRYGRRYWGIDRSTFLMDPQGVVRHVWRGVKADGHAKAVLEAIQRLQG